MARGARTSWRTWLRRSSVPPVAVTVLVLLGVTWRLTSFDQVRVRIDPLDEPGSPPLLRLGHDYRITGFIDAGRNPYRVAVGEWIEPNSVTRSISVEVDPVDVEMPTPRGMMRYPMFFGRVRDLRFDPSSKRFEGVLHVTENLDRRPETLETMARATMTLRLHFSDVAGRNYNSRWHPLPESERHFRIAPPGSPPGD